MPQVFFRYVAPFAVQGEGRFCDLSRNYQILRLPFKMSTKTEVTVGKRTKKGTKKVLEKFFLEKVLKSY